METLHSVTVAARNATKYDEIEGDLEEEEVGYS